MPARPLPLAVPLVSLALASCAPSLKVMPRIGALELEGDLLISEDEVDATNSVGDLGLDDREATPSALLDLEWGSPHLTLATQSTSFSGDGRLAGALEYEGNTIPAGADVASDLDLGIHSGILTFDVAPTPIMELGIGFGVTAVAIDARFREDGTGTTVDTDEVLPVPVLAARVGFWVDNVEVAGLISGMDASVDDADVQMLDLDVYARYHFFGFAQHGSGSVVLGWRRLDLDAEYEDEDSVIDAELRLTGPYLGVQFGF